MNKDIQEEKSIKDKIFDTAVPLFAMKGYAGVSVRELAKEAGVNVALISYYFGGKEKLYSHILSTQFEIIESALSHIQKKKLFPKDKIIYFLKHIIKFHNNYPYLMRLSISEIINPTMCYDQVVKNGITKIHYFLKSCVKEGIETGDFRCDIDPTVVAISLISTINFYFLTWPLSEDILPIEYYVDQIFDNQLKGILSKEK